MKLGVYTAVLHDRPRPEALGVIAELGLAGLNANGNPLHPDPAIGPRHAEDLRRAIRAAGLLGQTRVVTMSGLLGGEPGAAVHDVDPDMAVNIEHEDTSLGRIEGLRVAADVLLTAAAAARC